MVLGITRERTSLARRAVVPDRAGPVYGWDDWLIERGEVRWEASADLTGGFPGFAAHGGRLEGCHVRVTDRFLLIDEGRRRGFGLPLAWLIGADMLPSPLRGDRGEMVLRVRYSDCSRIRTFLLRFRGPFLAMRGGRRAEQALAALRSVGIEEDGEGLPPLPEIAHSWRDVAQFEQENVIWSGVASAALGFGHERGPCDVWLTTRSMIWGGGGGEGVLRLALDHVLDVVAAELDDRGRTPALYLACADETGGRHDLPFVFDRQHPAQRNQRERGALLVGLRSRGISVGTALPCPQPWQAALARVIVDDGLAPDEPIAVPVTRLIAQETEYPPATTFPAGVFGRGALKLLPRPFGAEESQSPEPPPMAWDEPAVDDGPVQVEDETVEHLTATDTEPMAPQDEPAAAAEVVVPPPSDLAAVDAYEDAVVAVLVEAAHGIEHRLAGGASVPPAMPVPSPAEQLAAHGRLDDLLARGELIAEDVRARRCRLVAVGEAGPRLRTLLELHHAGLLSDADLARKRAEIMGPLSEVLAPTGR